MPPWLPSARPRSTEIGGGAWDAADGYGNTMETKHGRFAMRLTEFALISILTGIAATAFAELPVTPPSSMDGNGDKPKGNANRVVLAPNGDSISFKNGDKLHGNLVSLEKGKLLWRYPKVADNIVFPLSPLKNMFLGKRPGRKEIRGDIRIYLTNGDVVPGRLVSLDGEKVGISTSYAGELSIPRVMVRQIAFDSKGIYLFRGPNSSQKWQIPKSGRYRNTVKITNSQIILDPRSIAGIKMPLPDNVEIAFEIAKPTREMRQKTFFFADKQTNKGMPNTYMLTIYGNGRFELERYTNNTGTDTIQSGSFSIDYSKALRVSIFVDKAHRKFTLSFNGKKRQQCEDSDYNDFAGRGKIIAFANDGGSQVAVRNIAVARWNGKGSAAVSDENDDGKKGENDTVFFLNGDRATGVLKSATPQEVVFATDFAELKVPPNRVTTISLAKNKLHMARKRADDAIITLANGAGRITLSIKSIKDGVTQGISENFGVAKFKLPAIEAVRFNIYDSQEDDGSDDNSEDNSEDEIDEINIEEF